MSTKMLQITEMLVFFKDAKHIFTLLLLEMFEQFCLNFFFLQKPISNIGFDIEYFSLEDVEKAKDYVVR